MDKEYKKKADTYQNELDNFMVELNREYDNHDCHASSEDGCNGCPQEL